MSASAFISCLILGKQSSTLCFNLQITCELEVIKLRPPHKAVERRERRHVASATALRKRKPPFGSRSCAQDGELPVWGSQHRDGLGPGSLWIRGPGGQA